AGLAAAQATADAARRLLDAAEAERAGQRERDAREQSVLRALAPVGESLGQMQRKMAELERDRSLQYGALAEQLRHSRESEEALRRTTDSLASALRSSSARGVWGETQLRRVVEAAGLTRHVDFDLQHATASDAGAGRPDMVVHLPGGKSLAVDAKVPLDAFLAASAIPDAAGAEAQRRAALLTAHAKAVRAHVDALAKRAYWNGLDTSPEFVICFLPNESLLSTALDTDPGLLEYAFGKRVALASPVNLWAVLKTVAYTWTQDAVSDQARELFALGNQLYDRLGSLVGHVDELRRGIERTVEGYNRLVGSLETRVLVSARRFPGIDDTRLSATDTPAVVERRPRTLTAPEFADALDAATQRLHDADGAVEQSELTLRRERS
ncbi:MAG: DNA recombination protein RmuC, partial [Microbacterium sp.]|uniref:DNA recombination protein RmuC n=1 Tax=Microbacterium sp. TaxID=51671 RepID=UPI0039E4D524